LSNKFFAIREKTRVVLDIFFIGLIFFGPLLFKDLLVEVLAYVGQPSPITLYFILLACATFVLPTTPVNILSGYLFGTITATLITSLAASTAIFLQSRLRSLMLDRDAREGSMFSLFRGYEISSYLVMFVLRINPVIPLPFSSALVKGIGGTKLIRMLLVAFAGTIPSAFLYSKFGYSLEKSTASSQTIYFIAMLCLCLPSLILVWHGRKKRLV